MIYYGLCGKDQKGKFPLTPQVGNLSIRASWAYVEPSPGQFQWDRIDAALAALPQGGVAGLTIHPGNNSPAWVMQQVAHITMPDNTQFPAPWDAKFLQSLIKLIQAVGQKYNSEQRIKHILIPALSAKTAENNLNNITKTSMSGGVPGHDTATPAQILAYWQSVNYS